MKAAAKRNHSTGVVRRKIEARSATIGGVVVTVATPVGKPKNRSAAEIKAAVRAYAKATQST